MRIRGADGAALVVCGVMLAVSWSGSAQAAGSPGTLDPVTGKPCAACHRSIVAGPNLHSALSGNECAGCHTTTGGNHQLQKGLFAPKAKGGKLCAECHDDLAKGASVHNPVKEGECLGCHYPHFSAHRKLLRQPGSQLCAECHDLEKLSRHSPHPPVKAGDCLACHAPHAGKAAKLIKQAEPPICVTCHDPATFKGKSVHVPVADGDCESCHLGHGGDRPKLLKLNVAAVPPVPYATTAYALCFDCHDPLLGTEKETLGVTGFRDGRQNLHRVHLQGSDPATCGTCHDFHASGQVKLLRAKAGTGKGEVTLSFSEAPNGGSCTTSCHDPMTYVRELSKRKR